MKWKVVLALCSAVLAAAAGGRVVGADDLAVEELTGIPVGPATFEASSLKQPLLIASAEEAKAHFKADVLEAVLETDFDRFVLLIFAWRGSGQDELTGAAVEDSSDSETERVVFRYRAGRTRDLRPHLRIFRLRVDVDWSPPS